MHPRGHEGYRIGAAEPEDIPAIARVHVDGWRSAYRGILPAAFLDSLSYAQREDLWRSRIARSGDRPLLVAREADGPVVGFAAAGRTERGVTSFDGELEALYVLETHQRRGVGSGLLTAAASALVEGGAASMFAWVFADNPAVHFCERLGGRRVDERSIDVAGALVEEVAFGWSDLVDEVLHRRPAEIAVESAGRPATNRAGDEAETGGTVDRLRGAGRPTRTS